MAESFLPPLAEDRWDPTLAEVRRQLGHPLNVHRVMAHHPELMIGWMPFRDHIVRQSTLDQRLRELLILRTAHLLDVAYEWEHHVARARASGVADEEIERLRRGPDAWSTEPEASVLRAADELCRGDRALSAGTAAALIELLGTRGLLDVIFTVGAYTTLAYLLRSVGVVMDPS